MFKKLFIHSPYRYLFSIVYTIVIVAVYNLLRDEWTLVVNYHDAFFIAGLSLVLIGLLSIVDYFGGLDIFRYMFRRRNPDGTKITLYDFSENRKEKLKTKTYRFVPFMTVGVIMIVVCLIFRAYI